jgi:hypothetical protein
VRRFFIIENGKLKVESFWSWELGVLELGGLELGVLEFRANASKRWKLIPL